MPRRASQRAHFVLHDPTEDDHAGSLPPSAGPRGRHGSRRRLRRMRQLPAHHAVGQPGREQQLPGHGVGRQRGGAHRRAAGGDHLAVPDQHRDAVRDRRRQPGQGGGQRFGLPATGAQDQAVRLPAQRRGDRRLQAGPGRGGRQHRRAHQAPGPVQDPGPGNAGRGQAVRRVRAVRPARPGHRPRRPGPAGERQAAQPARADRRGGTAPRFAAHLLLRAGPDLLLGDLGHLRRAAAAPTRDEEHRGHGQRGGGGRRLPAAVPRVHHQGQPRLHHPGRHDLLPSERGHRRQAPRLVGPDRRQGRARHRAQRRHRLPLGPAHHQPAAHRRGRHRPGRWDMSRAGPGRSAAKPGPAGPAQAATGRAEPAADEPANRPGLASSRPGPATGTSGPAGPAAGEAAQAMIPQVRSGRALAVASAALVVAVAVGVSVGPADLPLPAVGEALLTRLPWHPDMSVSVVAVTIVWQVRLPRVVLGALVGAMLAGGGAAYQGVFRNPLADPYLLGVAAGGGLGATMIIISGGNQALLPPAAFIGASLAVAVTYVLGATGKNRSTTGGATASIVLAGVAIAALFTAVQTYLQQEHTQVIQEIYAWILGSLTSASWSDVTMILPYAAVAAALLLAHRRLLDVLRVGEVEATSLGVDIARLRLTVVMAATLGTAAAVAVSGLIGFVGIIIPHTVRLTAGASYRIVLPVSMIGGAAFLVLADVAARTVQAPSEVPIGVITALAGAPFFLFVLRSTRARRELA